MTLGDTVTAAAIGAIVTLVGSPLLQYLSHKWTLSRERELAALRLRYEIYAEKYRRMLALTRERPRPQFTMDRRTSKVDAQEVLTTTFNALQWEQDQLYPLISRNHQARLSEARTELRNWLHTLQSDLVGPHASSEAHVPDGKPFFDAYEATLNQVLTAEINDAEQLAHANMSAK